MTEARFELAIPRAHPSYAGHFPGRPIVPGVLLLDLVLQRAEQWPAWGPPGCEALEIPVCKFVRGVLPGAALVLTLTAGAAAGALQFRLEQDGQLVASGSLRRQEGA